MSSRIVVSLGLLAAVLTFIICAGAGYWLFDLGRWPSIVVGALLSMMTLGATMLAVALGRRESSPFWVFWTPTRTTAYVACVAAFQILVGVLCWLTLEPPASTVTLVAGAGVGSIVLVLSVVEYSRLRKGRGKG